MYTIIRVKSGGAQYAQGATASQCIPIATSVSSFATDLAQGVTSPPRAGRRYSAREASPTDTLLLLPARPLSPSPLLAAQSLARPPASSNLVVHYKSVETMFAADL